MTFKRPTPFQLAELRHVCGYCGAPPGQWCVNSGGNRCIELHYARLDATNPTSYIAVTGPSRQV